MDTKEQTRERVKRYRERQSSVTKSSVTTDNVTPRYDRYLTAPEYTMKEHRTR